MKITVTREDIDKGEIGSAYRCPVALAVSRVCSGKVLASPKYVQIYGEEGFKEYETPENVTTFIRAFDNRQPVDPMDFDLCVRNK